MVSTRERALAKRSAEMSLMPPPPPPKRQKRPAKVIDEDQYSASLSKIIARDFFPGLLESDAQTEYLDAVQSQNNDWIREASRNLADVMTPRPGQRRRLGRGTSFTPARFSTTGQTPRNYVGDTPSATPRNDDFAPESEDVKDEVDINMSLGAFQAKYTSEDNESFNTLLDKQNATRAAKYAFFHNGNKIPSARQISWRVQEMAEANEVDDQSTSLVLGSHDDKGAVVLRPNRPSADLDARKASVESFRDRQGPRNNFMFGPDSVEDRLPTAAQQAEEASNAPPKSVSYAQTRFPTTQAPSSVAPSPSLSAIDAAIAGRPRPSASDVGYSGAETPRVNGYAFVDAEPTPEELGVPVTDEDAERIEREAMAQLLPKADPFGPNPFNIASRSKREDVHMRLVEKADIGRRKGGQSDKLRALGITPARTPASVSNTNGRKSVAMTPAAQRLAQSISTPRRAENMFGRSDRGQDQWTPSSRNRKA